MRWLGEAGLDGVFVAGTTGEGVLLENDEVEALVERAVAGAGSLRVIAQVGRPSTRATVRAGARARSTPARDGVAAYVPWFYPVTQVQVRARTSSRVLEAADDAPAFIYNIPPRTVNDLDPALAGELARDRVRGDEGLDRRPRAPPGVPGRRRGIDDVRALHRHRAADPRGRSAPAATGSINALSNCRARAVRRRCATRSRRATRTRPAGCRRRSRRSRSRSRAEESTVAGGQAPRPRPARRARRRLPGGPARAVRVSGAPAPPAAS